jgi:hypothetical protein
VLVVGAWARGVQLAAEIRRSGRFVTLSAGAIRGCLAATGGRTLYIYPELYQGQECAKYVFCTGPTPAQNATNPSPKSSRRWAGSVSLMLAANYVAPRLYNKYAHRVIEANGGDCVL